MGVPTGNSFYDAFCMQLYMRASFSKCLNRRIGTPTMQWCYVSTECEWAEKVEGTSVAVHLCTEDDDFMNDTAPEELNKLGLQDDLDRGLLGKLSYAVEQERWS